MQLNKHEAINFPKDKISKKTAAHLQPIHIALATK